MILSGLGAYYVKPLFWCQMGKNDSPKIEVRAGKSVTSLTDHQPHGLSIYSLVDIADIKVPRMAHGICDMKKRCCRPAQQRRLTSYGGQAD